MDAETPFESGPASLGADYPALKGTAVARSSGGQVGMAARRDPP